MDLEQYRVAAGLSYEGLAAALGMSNRQTVQRYCAGAMSPRTHALETILRRTNGQVSLYDMHRRRMAWLEARGRGVKTGGRKTTGRQERAPGNLPRASQQARRRAAARPLALPFVERLAEAVHEGEIEGPDEIARRVRNFLKRGPRRDRSRAFLAALLEHIRRLKDPEDPEALIGILNRIETHVEAVRESGAPDVAATRRGGRAGAVEGAAPAA